jgi:signal transduction histidine kinase
MVQATDKRPYLPTPGTIAERLMSARERILSAWVDRLKQRVSVARTESEPIIINTLPAFIENLAQALDRNFPRELATEGTTTAAEHGGERARVTRYGPGEVILEYQLLRDIIFRVLSESKPIEGHEADIIIKSIDQAMMESLTAYFLVHQGIREQFTMTLTHDLRNPLSAIRATADLILRSYAGNRSEQIPHLAARIAENVRRCDRMIQDLLDTSRVRVCERIHFKVDEFELRSMIQEILDQMTTIHGDRFVLHGNPMKGYWNRDAFKRAIENLINNAIKYGDPRKPITVRLEEIHRRTIVSVRNEGPHIPVEEQENLFRSFIRSEAARSGKKEGWGLGLAMVRGMAEGHGGSVTVDSAPERGTTFIIDLPIDSRPHVSHPMTPGT